MDFWTSLLIAETIWLPAVFPVTAFMIAYPTEEFLMLAGMATDAWLVKKLITSCFSSTDLCTFSHSIFR